METQENVEEPTIAPAWMRVEKPHIKHENILNEHVLGGMDKAKGCAKWLVAQGFTVLSVAIGRRNPRIEIQHCRRCAALDGAVFMRERTTTGEHRGWVAIRFECEVRWMDGGAA